jgi:beta-galactosidase
MGRVNFGTGINDHKGLHSPVQLDGAELGDWKIFTLPLDDKMLAHLKFSAPETNSPAFWRATVNVKQPGDTFLDMRSWGKGVVWVNGHCLGRFWDIGPTQTVYVPGPWLKRGKNKILILDLLGPEKPVVAALNHPVLDELHPENDFNRPNED